MDSRIQLMIVADRIQRDLADAQDQRRRAAAARLSPPRQIRRFRPRGRVRRARAARTAA